jgi:hypothetical protein
MIDPNKIITEGKFDEDLHEDPVMVMVDAENESLQEAEEELFLGDADDMALVDIVCGEDDVSIDDIEKDEYNYLHNTDTPKSQR